MQSGNEPLLSGHREGQRRGVQLTAGALATACGLGLVLSSRHFRSENLAAAPLCHEGGVSPCLREDRRGIPGDAGKDGFARKDENLVLYEDFSQGFLDSSLWQVEANSWGDGNNCFHVYTNDQRNVYINKTDKSLRLKPGLFAEQGTIETEAGPQSAADAMVGNCEPYPACATFTVPGCTMDPAIPNACTRTADRWGFDEVLGPATSGKVTTKGKFSYTYGRLEVEMRLPAADWLWPAVWLMPEEERYGPWPTYGEIDVLEARGNMENFTAWGNAAGRDRLDGTIHFYGNAWWTPTVKGQAIADPARGDWSTHKFTLGFYWSENDMYMYVRDPVTGKEVVYQNATNLKRPQGEHAFFDAPLGAPHNLPNLPDEDAQKRLLSQMTEFTADPEKEPYHTGATNAPFDQPFYLILNVAVGGAQFGCPKPDWWGEQAVWCKCWPNCHGSGEAEFWRRAEEWLPSWRDAEARDRLGMVIHSVKLWQ